MDKFKYEIELIDKENALGMVRKYHYSNTLPKLNKLFVGFKLNGNLVGIVTLGWGTRPKHTIKKLFPSLDTKDYLEIGRMCMTEEMPRNSESQMLSQLIAWLKQKYPEIKVLFTWADGMLGKVGYVYQASNFLYAGFSETDFYMKDGVKLHPRQTRAIFSPNDERVTVRPTLQQCIEHNIAHYRGKQFKYIYFLCDKRTKKTLERECIVKLGRIYPKEKDLKWRKRQVNGKWGSCEKPPYQTDIDRNTKDNFEIRKVG